MNFRKLTAVNVLGFLLAAAPANASTLVGDEVDAEFVWCCTSPDLVPFDGPAVVDSNVEFTGSFTDNFGQNWTLDFDVTDTGLILDIFGFRPSGGANVFGGSDLISFSLFDIDQNGVWAFNSFTGPGNASLNSFDSTNGQLSFNLSSLQDGQRYSFGFQAPAVPEPGTWAMLLLGLGFVGGAMRFNKRRANSAVSYA